MSFYHELRPECTTDSFYTTGKQKKMDCFHVDGYCDHCKTVFEAMGVYYHFRNPSKLSEQDIKKRKSDELRLKYIKEKGYKI